MAFGLHPHIVEIVGSGASATFSETIEKWTPAAPRVGEVGLAGELVGDAPWSAICGRGRRRPAQEQGRCLRSSEDRD